jgi:FADH2 O2-dependent halogenase
MRRLPNKAEFDVAIIGGGPAGATIASYCAMAGVRCCVLERDVFPRFHIGESFVPSSTRIFKEIGFLDKMEGAGFLRKVGAGWTEPRHPRVYAIDFGEREQEGVDMLHTYHVPRDKFDAMLLEHASSLGASVYEGVRVTHVDVVPERPPTLQYVVNDKPMSVTAKVVVDASGRRTLLGNQLKLKTMDPVFDQYAIHTWFEGFGRTVWDEHTLIHFLPMAGGWMWQIPISETVTSIGVVTQKRHFRAAKKSREDFFWQCVGTRPELFEGLRQAAQVHPLREEGDYSYAMRQVAGDRWVLIGDAARFVDPIFSSGVSIALTGAKYASRDILESLRVGEFSPASFETYVQTLRHGTKNWYEFISLYYRLNVLFTSLILDPAYRLDVLKLLQGDLYDEVEPPVLGKMRRIVEVVERNPKHVWHERLADLAAPGLKPAF